MTSPDVTVAVQELTAFATAHSGRRVRVTWQVVE